MTRYFVAVAAVLLISGCGRSTEDICQETDQLLRQTSGSGFTAVGLAGCLALPASEAQRSLDGLKASTGRAATELIPRAGIEQLHAEHGVVGLVRGFGVPDLFYHAVLGAEPLNERNTPFEIVVSNLGLKKDGHYLFSWRKPISKDFFGSADESLMAVARVEEGKVVESRLIFPDYFWQAWFK